MAWWRSIRRMYPFWRAPWLLLGNKAVVAAVGAAALVLGYVSAVTPLFVSSAANAAVGTEIERRCAGDVGGTLDHWTTVARARGQIAELEATTTAFGDPILTLEVLPRCDRDQ